MEAHPNEYVAQLLDRAANLITEAAEGLESANPGSAEGERQWLREYHAEKARFGQPLGSPAYADAVQVSRGENDPARERKARRAAGVDTADTGLPARDDGSPAQETADYSDWTLEELTDEAKRRGIPSSGTKADVRTRLEADDDAQA